MKKSIILLVMILLVFSSTINLQAATQAPGESWLGIAIFNPVQYPDQSFSIRGLRLNAFYAVNEDLTGIDLGVIFPFNYLRGDMTGLQMGIYNEVGNKTTGVQWGFVNRTEGDLSGVQFGMVNYSEGYHRGVQASFYNRADHISGLQLGFVNSTRSLHGLQLGLMNFKEEVGPGIPRSMPMRGFPLLNWTF